jgi:hypothetical protein
MQCQLLLQTGLGRLQAAFEPVGRHFGEIIKIHLAITINITGHTCHALSDFGTIKYRAVYFPTAAAVVLPDDRILTYGRVSLVIRVVGDSKFLSGCKVISEYV